MGTEFERLAMSDGLGQFPQRRLRRLRGQANLRALIRDVHLSVDDFIYPLFIHHGTAIKQPIASMPGCYQLSVDQLAAEVSELQALGISRVILFGLPATKNAEGTSACAADGVVQSAIQELKCLAPELYVIVDVCFCEYTDHGHCGMLGEVQGHVVIDNDKTLPRLVEQALSFLAVGADMIAPSGMMDGVVAALRQGLDEHGYQDIPILSYAVKYASALYGPFREAADGTPQFGDRKSYQMDPANRHEALQEAQLDVQEGADLLMVKPALAYLDIIARLKAAHPAIPLVAYQVSGEYAMLKAAHAQGWLDEQAVALEMLTSIKRAGADVIITYYAKQAAAWLAAAKKA